MFSNSSLHFIARLLDRTIAMLVLIHNISQFKVLSGLSFKASNFDVWICFVFLIYKHS